MVLVSASRSLGLHTGYHAYLATVCVLGTHVYWGISPVQEIYFEIYSNPNEVSDPKESVLFEWSNETHQYISQISNTVPIPELNNSYYNFHFGIVYLVQNNKVKNFNNIFC